MSALSPSRIGRRLLVALGFLGVLILGCAGMPAAGLQGHPTDGAVGQHVVVEAGGGHHRTGLPASKEGIYDWLDEADAAARSAAGRDAIARLRPAWDDRVRGAGRAVA
jgi:hypothetical protein